MEEKLDSGRKNMSGLREKKHKTKAKEENLEYTVK